MVLPDASVPQASCSSTTTSCPCPVNCPSHNSNGSSATTALPHDSMEVLPASLDNGRDHSVDTICEIVRCAQFQALRPQDRAPFLVASITTPNTATTTHSTPDISADNVDSESSSEFVEQQPGRDGGASRVSEHEATVGLLLIYMAMYAQRSVGTGVYATQVYPQGLYSGSTLGLVNQGRRVRFGSEDSTDGPVVWPHGVSRGISPAPLPPLVARLISHQDLSVSEGPTSCGICLEEVVLGETVHALPCNHWFHRVCILQWLERGGGCPFCRD